MPVIQPPPPPPPAPDAAIPAGNIYVFDTNLPSIASGGSEFPVQKIRVVARRWFKIERTFTDVNGHFTFTKHFKDKVRIIEKFKNSDANIYNMRGVRLWQLVLPVQRTLGIYSGNRSNIKFPNDQNGPVNSKANIYWAAATVHNAVQEHIGYASQFGFARMPSNMHILITHWAKYGGAGATPMFHHNPISPYTSSQVKLFLADPLKVFWSDIKYAGMASIATILGIDQTIDYNPRSSFFLSDGIKTTAYHEMSHASQFSSLGPVWYSLFVQAELNEIAAHGSDSYTPYGTGNTSNSPIIALGEAWGYHMGHFLADQRYGVNAYTQIEQPGYDYDPHGTNHPDIDVLEYFIPGLQTDPFHWIPKGLMEDLMDNTIEPTITGVNDQVSGFTIAQIFNAYQSDITSVPAYKVRFIQQNPRNHTTQITNLFASYSY